MLELALATAVLLVLLATAGGEGVVHLLYVGGAGAILLGMGAGVPAGVAYHLLLRRALAASGVLPPRWWWHPTRLHDRLSDAGRRSVLPWFRAGAAGFLLALVGCALILAALLA